MKYKGVKTEINTGVGESRTYYEKAFDRNGEGIDLGDKVKVVSKENNPEYSVGNTYEVKSIFEGDLMLGDEMFYCWPNNVVKL